MSNCAKKKRKKISKFFSKEYLPYEMDKSFTVQKNKFIKFFKMVKKCLCLYFWGGIKLKNLLKRSRDYNFPISIKLVVSNNPRARGVNFAKKYSIPC